ncbi:MAG TPA: aminotransferase class I/II-fold pyridoxal phosphate-dependent enzyme, partial [Terriglobia bacterium]|nr:aminotransferase class I/II-fold pyridoxal phosphate-dependent enzyme [Terriglobia bacterium]
RLSDDYYRKLRDDYLGRRDRLLEALTEAGFKCFKPFGAYYIMSGISGFGFSSDLEFTRYLIEKIGIAAVPGSSFYNDRVIGSQQLRFTFCKKEATLDEAGRRLKKLNSR